jgi:hypothetical protein
MKHWMIYAVICMAVPASAQEFTGLKVGNYTGSNGMLMNPSALLSGNLPWDVNLVSAGAFAQNNYLFFPQQSAISLLATDNPETDFFTTDHVNAHTIGMVQGPSGFFRTSDFALGLFTTGRTASFVHSETFPDGVNVLEDIQIGVPVQVAAFDAGVMNWYEIGLTGAMVFSRNLHIGASVKYLGGYDAITMHNRDAFTFTKTEKETLVSNLLLDYSYTNNLGGDAGFSTLQYEQNGWGLGADLGFTWIEPVRGPKKNEAAYAWKLGVSVVDLGFIRFKQNAGSYHLNANDAFSVQNPVLDSLNNADELTTQGSAILYDDILAAQVDDKFPVLTPTAISIQGAVNLGKGFFVHTIAYQNVAFVQEQMIARPNVLAIIPQFDTRMLTVSLPVTVYDYEETHVGASVRFMYFTVGTDNLGSLLVPGSLDGADIYAGIRIFPYQLAGSGSKVGSRNGRSRSNQLSCPSVF